MLDLSFGGMGSRKTHAVGDGRLRGDAVVLNGDGLEADIGRVPMREASVPFLVRRLASADLHHDTTSTHISANRDDLHEDIPSVLSNPHRAQGTRTKSLGTFTIPQAPLITKVGNQQTASKHLPRLLTGRPHSRSSAHC